MTPIELYRDGKLREAIKALGEELRSNPLDAKRRTFLFELLLFAGEYDRAEKHLDLLAQGSGEAVAGALLYRSALHAERTREQMFARRETPPAAEDTGRGGRWNGKEFTEMSDSDPRIGSNFEVFLAGSYSWIPMRYVTRLVIEPAKNLRDLKWVRARMETSQDFPQQELGEILLPAICPLSSRHPDEAVHLGRESAWEQDEQHGEIPYGAKMLLIDGVDVPLLELRDVEWNSAVKESSDALA